MMLGGGGGGAGVACVHFQEHDTRCLGVIVCLCIPVLFWRSLLSVPVKFCPPGGRSGAGMLTRAAASVNPAH